MNEVQVEIIPQAFLTSENAAKYLDMGKKTFRNYVSRGLIPAYRNPKTRTVRFRIADLDAWLTGAAEPGPPDRDAEWFTPDEAAGYLRLRRKTFSNYVSRGLIPFHQNPVTRTKRYHKDDLDRWLTTQIPNGGNSNAKRNHGRRPCPQI